MTQLRTRRWEELLTPEQKEKYSNAIRKGYFATYDGYAWRHTFYGAFIWKHPGRVKVVNIFKSIIGHAPQWEDLTDDNLHDFREQIIDSYAPNSARTIFAEVNAVIRENSSKPVPSLKFGEVLHAKKVPTQAVYLSDEEIARLNAYNPRTLAMRHAKRIFMLECLCGARLSSDTLRTGIQHQHTRNVQGVRHRHRSKGVPCRTRPTGTQVRIRIHTHWAPLLRNQPRPQRRSDRANRDDDGTHVRQRTQHSHDPTLHHGAALTIPRSLRSLPPARCRKDRTRAANTRQVYPRLTSLPVAFTYKKMPFYAIA